MSSWRPAAAGWWSSPEPCSRTSGRGSGTARPLDEEESPPWSRPTARLLERAASLDPTGFWAHVVADLDTRRVCGLAPIWALLKSLGTAAKGKVLHYEQTVDREDGSIVSHAAVGFYE